MNYLEKLAAAFIVARRGAPYFDAALTGMVRIEVPGLAESSGIVGLPPTMGVTAAGVLMYEREAIERWSVEETAAVLIHEVGHLLRNHHDRCKSFGGHPDVFNIAGDLEINDDMGAWKLPDGHVTPAKFGAPNGRTAEEYYAFVESKVTYVCCCGSGAGRAFKNEPGESAGRTEGEIQVIRHKCAEAISKTAGKVPGGWAVWAKTQLQPPKVRWQDRLARATRRAISSRPGGATHTWRRLSRRQSACGYGPGRPVIPALTHPQPTVAVAIDTSGSMSDIELGIAVREAVGIIRGAGGAVTLVAIDADVHACKSVRSVSEISSLLRGGGGTDFRPAFERLRNLAPVPDVVIYATDGCGPAPAEPPAWCSVVWLLVGKQSQSPCTWGEQIEVCD